MPANSIDDCKTFDAAQSATAQPLPPGVTAGAAVLLRGRRCTLDASVAHPDCCELHLVQLDDSRRRVLLWPFDRPAPVHVTPRARAVRLRAWAAAVQSRAASATDAETPRASCASVDVLPFQLAPALAMAAGASRILLADEVGLGKTIQAGWILADLLAREPGTRVLLAVPAGLRHQWAGELSSRFAVDAAVVDARWLRAAVADLPADVSPWAPPGVYIGSLDFLKRPDVAASIALHVWDLLVVDEAHTAAAPTDRHSAIGAFAARSRRVIAITATPYSGHPAGFASLTTLGTTRGATPPLMFRRSRRDVGDPRKRRHHFAPVRITAAEAHLQRLLERYSRDVWKDGAQDVAGARLAVTILRKRALSSPAAAARSLRRRLELLGTHAHSPRQLQLFDDEDAIDDDIAPAALGAPGLADAAREQRYLASLIAAADTAQGRDSKLRYVQRLITRLRGESIVIFTEYRDTLLQLAGALPPAFQLHGGLTAAERIDVQERFNREGGLLLATDAAAEGLNLHQHCRLVVNYELPWNPARLEQRIGRVDRIGQRRTVHALTLTARDTAEDLVLRNLARRLLRVVVTLGQDDRLGAFLDDARIAGIVIGGETIADLDEHDIGEQPVVRADGNLEPAARAARRLSKRFERGGRRPPQFSPSTILVSNLRARERSLAAGYATVITCSARTADGFLVAQEQVVLHLRGTPAQPRSADAARQVAKSMREHLALRAIVPDLDRWFADVRHAHEAAVQHRIARELEIMDRTVRRDLVQPGLFDRRAVAAAERDEASHDGFVAEHRRHIAALERSRALDLTCELSAVLIAWR